MVAALFVLLIILTSLQNLLRADDTENVISSSNLFSIDVYQALAKKDGNVLYCPVSLNILLALTTLAAGEETATELKTSLHLNIGNDDIQSGYKELINNLEGESLQLATRIYVDKEIRLIPEFVKSAQMYFNSDVQQIDYNNSKHAANIINKYVEENTNNKIHDLVSAESLNSDTALLLVNAANFKEDWKTSFKCIGYRKFYLKKNHEEQTQMMANEGDYNYTELKSLDAKVIQIPYKSEGYSMLIILPNEHDGLNEVENRLKLINFEDIYNNLTRHYVKLTVPEFKMENTMELKDVLEQLGIKTVFTSKANLTGMVNQTKLCASKVTQKTYINFGPTGVEAASATAIHMERLKTLRYVIGKIFFTADHPFIFVLMKGKLILFLGRFSQII